jgi:hypothetical protein
MADLNMFGNALPTGQSKFDNKYNSKGGAGGIQAASGLASTVFTAFDKVDSDTGIGTTAAAIGKGAASGAAMGAMLGPWGAAIGGVIGGAAGAITNVKAQKEAERALQEQKVMENQFRLRQPKSINPNGNPQAEIFKYGGTISSQSFRLNTGIKKRLGSAVNPFNLKSALTAPSLNIPASGGSINRVSHDTAVITGSKHTDKNGGITI